MDVLFIHGNYPAQFRHLCAGMGCNSENRVIFLTAREDAARESLAGVQIINYATHRKVHAETHPYVQATEDAVLQGQAVLRSLDQLLQQGFQPRVVIFHAGMGLGLFLRDVLPHAKLIGYFEWWFTPETSRHLVQKFDLNMQLTAGMRNLPTLQELERCDAAVVPTQWQKQQFPNLVQSKLEVIFDGVDTRFFHPPTEDVDTQELVLRNRETQEAFRFSPGTPILSYATRGMEPLRGFPEFMRALPSAFKAVKGLEVVIAGADRCAYSYAAPSNDGSWKQHLLKELKTQIPIGRIHFTGLLNYVDYRALLWRSNLHCYFTRPYVTSWSLFEAAACGARLCVNRCQATEGVVADPATVTWVDLDDLPSLSQTLQHRLRSGSPRSNMDARHSLQLSLQHWQAVVNKALTQSS